MPFCVFDPVRHLSVLVQSFCLLSLNYNCNVEDYQSFMQVFIEELSHLHWINDFFD